MVSNKILGQTPIQKINHVSMIDERPYIRNIKNNCQNSTDLEHRKIMLNPSLPKWKTKPSIFFKTVHTKDTRETNWSYSVYLIRKCSSVYQKIIQHSRLKTFMNTSKTLRSIKYNMKTPLPELSKHPIFPQLDFSFTIDEIYRAIADQN